MALEEHSFRHLLPAFLISRGTQVVLKVAGKHRTQLIPGKVEARPTSHP